MSYGEEDPDDGLSFTARQEKFRNHTSHTLKIRELITIKIYEGRCAYCGKQTEVENRGFSDCGSPVTNAVCFPCQVAIGMAAPPRCPMCKECLMYFEKQNVWACCNHGKQEAGWKDSRLFKYKRVKK